MPKKVEQMFRKLDRFQSQIENSIQTYLLRLIFQPHSLIELVPPPQPPSDRTLPPLKTNSEMTRHSRTKSEVSKLNFESAEEPAKQTQNNKLKSKPKGKLRAPIIINHALPKPIRLNPFAERKPIRNQEIKRGIYNLINEGLIFKFVDVAPAFEKEPCVMKVAKANIQSSDKQLLPAYNDGYQKNNNSQSWALTQFDSQIKSQLLAPTKRLKIQIPKEQVKKAQAQLYPGMATPLSLQHLYVVSDTVQNKSYLQQLVRTGGSALEGEIREVLFQLMSLIKRQKLNFVYINLSVVLSLTLSLRKLTDSSLLLCLVGHNTLRSRPKMTPEQAAAIIKNHLRRWVVQRKYQQLMRRKNATKKLVKHLQNVWLISKTKRKIKQLRAKNLLRQSEIQQKFMSDFKQIVQDQHVVINITADRQQQFKEITRLFQLSNPLLSTIIISKRSLPLQMVSYYQRILDLNNINFKERLIFFQADQDQNYPSNYSTTNVIVFQHKILQRLKAKINKRPAFLVCSKPNYGDVLLSVNLEVPILSPDFLLAQQLSTKSGGLSLLKGLGFKTVGDYVRKGSNLKQILISCELCGQKWRSEKVLLKLQDEEEGRGTAAMQLSGMTVLNYQQRLHLPAGSKLTKIEFLKRLSLQGGVVEPYLQSAKSALFSFLRLPSASPALLTTTTRLALKLTPIGYLSPQEALDEQQAQALEERLTEYVSQKIVGYINFEFLSWKGEVLGLGVDCFKTRLQSGYDYYKYLLNGNKPQNTLQNSSLQVQYLQHLHRAFVYLPSLTVKGIKNMVVKTFFPLCRTENISFDLIEKFGSAFVLVDSLSRGQIGVLCVGQKTKECMWLLTKVIKFMSKLGEPSQQYQLREVLGLIEGR